MAKIITSPIANDNIISYSEFYNSEDLIIYGQVEDIAVGEELTLELNNKTITTIVGNEGYFEFHIPKIWAVDESEMYIQELENQKIYIFTITHESSGTTGQGAFFINISSSIMDSNTFKDGNETYNGLPQNGDPITAEMVNYGPIQNRDDLIELDGRVGNINTLIDVKSDTFDSTVDKTISGANTNLVDSISQLRIDTGNKSKLLTSNKVSIVNAINELKNDMYKPSNALTLVADYDYMTNGNYVLSGGNISYSGSVLQSSIPANNILMKTQPYEVVRDISCYPTSTTKYNKFSIPSSKIVVQGYEISIPNSLNFYFPDTMEDNQVNHKIIYEDDIFISRIGTSGTNHIYVVPYLETTMNGLFEVVRLEGSKLYSGSYTFTTNGSATQELVTDLRNAVQSTQNIIANSVKILSIPSVLTVNGTSYNCAIESNGYGIVWTNGTPPSGLSCTISNGNLSYIAIIHDSNLSGIVSLNTTKDQILLKTSLNFIDVSCSFNRISPRYDRIYMEANYSIYNSRLWNQNTTYDISDYVIYSGHSFRSLTNSNLGNNPLTSSNNWLDLGLYYEGVTLKPKFVYIEGYNNENGYPVKPTLNNPKAIPLCGILYEYGQPPIIRNEFVSTFKMKDLKNLETLVNDGMYNLARLSTTYDLSATDLNLTRNMFVDPFFDNDFRDIELETAHSSGAKSMFINNGILTHSITFTPVYAQASTFDKFIQFNNIEYTNVPLVEQPKFSRSVLINKYQVSTPPKVTLTVSPMIYDWFAETKTNTLADVYKATLNGVAVDYSSVSSLVTGSSTSSVTNWTIGTITSTTTSNTVTQSKEAVSEIVTSIITEPKEVPQHTLRITAPNYSFNGGEELSIQLGSLEDVPELAGLNSGITKYATDTGGLDVSFSIGKNTLYPFYSDGTPKTLTVQGIGITGKPEYISLATGVASVTHQPYLKIINNYNIITRDVIRTTSVATSSFSMDPLAQSFVLDKNATLHSIYVMIDAIEGNNPNYTVETSDTVVNQHILAGGVLPEDLDISIYETTAGFPDHEKLLATGVILKGTSVNQGSNTVSPSYNKVEMFPKVKLEKDKTYAFVVAGPFETHKRMKKTGTNTWIIGIGEDNIRLKLRSVKLGERFPNPGNKLTLQNEQAYINGVMFSSSNKVTWTAHQDEDLTFKLTECKFVKDNKIVNFDTNTNTYSNITDIVFQMGVSTPGDTSISHIIQHGSTLQNSIDILNGEHKKLLSKISSISKHRIQATLKTTEVADSNGYVLDSPVLFKESSIYFGTLDATSVYVTKNIDLTKGEVFTENKKLRLYLDFLGSFDSSRIKVYYTTASIISSGSWVEMFLDSSYIGPSIERRYLANSTDTSILIGNYLRIKIVLLSNIDNTSHLANRIGIQNLRVFAY